MARMPRPLRDKIRRATRPDPGSAEYIRVKRKQAESRREAAEEAVEDSADELSGLAGLDALDALSMSTTAATRRRAAVIADRAPVKKLRVVAEKKHAEVDRAHRAEVSKLRRVSDDIESGKMPPAKVKQAVSERRKLAAKATALHLRKIRARLSKRILVEAENTKDKAHAEGLRRAAAAIMTAPLIVKKGKIVPVCPKGYRLAGMDGLSGFGDLGLPGGAYTGSEAVPQHSMIYTPGGDGGAFEMRHSLFAAVGALFADRPPDVQLPAVERFPIAALRNAMPAIPPSPIQANPPRLPIPGPGGPLLPALRRPAPPALIQHPLYRRSLLPPARLPAQGMPAGVGIRSRIAHERQEVRQEIREDRQEAREDRREAAIRRRIRLNEFGGLAEDMVLADAFGAYDVVVGGVEDDMDGFDDLAGFGKIGKRARSWKGRFGVHKARLGRNAIAALLGLGAAGAGHTGAASFLTGGLLDTEAQAQADEEVAATEEDGGKVDGARRAKHIGFLRRWFKQHGRPAGCVKA